MACDEALASRLRGVLVDTGRPMKAMVFVEPAGLDGTGLQEWVAAAAAFARTLPPKSARKPGNSTR